MSTDRIYAQERIQSSPNLKYKREKKSEAHNINNSAVIQINMSENQLLSKFRMNTSSKSGFNKNKNIIIKQDD